MKFNNQWDRRPKYAGSENDGEIVVERAGFIPAQRRIEDILLAGQRLQQSRMEQYDYGDGVDDGRPIDPNRILGLDIAEASQLQNQVYEKLQESARLASEAVKAAEKASKSAKTEEDDK